MAYDKTTGRPIRNGVGKPNAGTRPMRNGMDNRPVKGSGFKTVANPLSRQINKQVPADEVYTVGKVKRKFKYNFFNLGVGLDLPLLIIVLILLAVGLVMLFSASYASAYYEFGNSYHFIYRQGIFVVAGIVIMLIASLFDYHHFHKMAKPIFIISIIMLAMVLIFKDTDLAPIKGGANRWLKIGFEFQPSEIAKFTLVIMLAHIISIVGERVKTFIGGVVPCFFCTALVAGLVIAEKHVSATIIILVIACVIMFIGGIKMRWFAGIGGIGALVIAYLVFFTDKFAYALVRVQGWIDPFNPPAGVDTYQTRQSLYAIGSGQMLGVGLGQSRQKYLYLPEPQNDFIFAIICEELGFVGALMIILLFVALIWRGVVISINAKDKFGMLVGLGMTFTVGVQTVFNICVVTNAFPNTGIGLPFFSYGGTSLIILMAEMGVLLSVSRGSYMEKI